MNEIERLNKSNKIIIELNKEISKYKQCFDYIEEVLLSNYITSYDIGTMLEKIKELKGNLSSNKDAFNSICVEKYKLEQCLDEIEKVCNSCRENAYCFDCKYDNYCQSELQDYILQFIKQAKGN